MTPLSETAQQLYDLLKKESVESCEEHPGDQALVADLIAVYEATKDTVSYVAADAIFLLGRQKQTPDAWDAAAKALLHEDETVRDYAVQTFERWGNPAAIPLLQKAWGREVEQWLENYIKEIISDLQNTEKARGA